MPADWIAESTQPISITDEQYGLAYAQLWNVLVPEEGDPGASFHHTGLGDRARYIQNSKTSHIR